MMPRHIIGIDPGKTGAVAVLKNEVMVSLVKCPVKRVKTGRAPKEYDLAAMYALLHAYSENAVVYMERVGAFPIHGRVQGAVSMFSFGEGYGGWRMAATALGLPLVLVRPQAWKQALLKGTDRGKDAAIRVFKKRWPTWSLTPGKRVVEDHNLAEAALIALYGAWQVGPQDEQGHSRRGGPR